MEIDEVIAFIDTQFEHNKLKDIFSSNEENIEFNDIAEQKLNKNRQELVKVLQNDSEILLEALSKKFLKAFFETNEYMRFTKQECKKILDIYNSLFNDILNYELNSNEIEKKHYERIKEFIKASQQFVYSDNNGKNVVDKKAYSEYSPEFQLNLLEIKLDNIKGKVLDIGCGVHAHLVYYLRENGIDAYGIDRECEQSKYVQEVDWLDKDYGEKVYDTIISNISFSSHFLSNHIKEDGDFEDYAMTYMKILNSLKVGGKWYYAPALDFIEELLPEDRFEVRNSFINDDIMKTVITRLI